jgi:pimeloyl-ACP methyl ester carboxylesterase
MNGQPDWIDHLPQQSRELAGRVPRRLRPWIDAEIGHLLTPDVLARFTPEMADWPAARAWRALFPPTALNAIRMEAEVGEVCAISCRRHPRFSYFTYVPMRAQLDRVEGAPLIVTIHGSERNAYAARDRFARFAEEQGCFVLAPLFPMDMADSDPDEQYKYVYTPRVMFDQVVLDMVEEFAVLLSASFGPLLLHGYSGGGQFVHRFLYRHAERVAAASIGAPGYVTLPERDLSWPAGLRGLSALTGEEPRPEALSGLPIHLHIGEKDDFEIDAYEPAELGLTDEQYARYGLTRRQRLDRLADGYRKLGAEVTFDVVPGHGHATTVEPVLPFFRRILEERR